MDTVRDASRSTTAAGGAALGLAAVAALSLTAAHLLNRGTGADELVTLGMLLGWTLTAWSAIVGVVVAVQLGRGLARRRTARADILLLVATVAVIAATLAVYPPFGSGGASA
ncbi:hypothetical protein [Microbacterium sp. JZ31]|uniref:hypothetical protein n=1 Tax=Microbacterium sp. JZ31 TaxID=1906274 RepID=UPI00193402F6|nr:hypothetical protein [Microbacterium sp. JZ31]